MPNDVNQQNYEALCKYGKYLNPHEAEIASVENLTYQHPKRGRQNVSINLQALPGVERFYTNSPLLRATLNRYGNWVSPFAGIHRMMSNLAHSGRIIWGFSGYASPAPTVEQNYEEEGAAMSAFYEYLAGLRREPGLIVDGGGGEGILGLNGVIAQQYNFKTLGIVPLQGLESIAPRDRMMVWGDLFPEREILVGIVPDVLVCVGGGDGARRECEAALDHNGVVMLIAVKNYGPGSFCSSYSTSPSVQKAIDEERFIVCKSAEFEEVSRCAELALTKHLEVKQVNFANRLAAVEALTLGARSLNRLVN